MKVGYVTFPDEDKSVRNDVQGPGGTVAEALW